MPINDPLMGDYNTSNRAHRSRAPRPSDPSLGKRKAEEKKRRRHARNMARKRGR